MSLKELLGDAYSLYLPLVVDKRDPFNSEPRILSNGSMADVWVGTAINRAPFVNIREDEREEDCREQDEAIRESIAFANLFAASPELYEALECMADTMRFAQVNAETRYEIITRWLPLINKHFPPVDKAFQHAPHAMSTAMAFGALSGLLCQRALAKDRGEQTP